MSTKADLLAAWCRWTGDSLPEARHRVRALAEDGLLPSRQQPIDHADIARTLIGFVATARHDQAAATVRKFSQALCGAASGAGETHPLMGMTLLEAITTALQPPCWINMIRVNTTSGECHLMVTDMAAGFPGWTTEYSFHDHNALPLPVGQHPVNLSRSIHAALIGHLLTDLMGHPALPILGSAAGDATPARAAPPLDDEQKPGTLTRQGLGTPSSAESNRRVCAPATATTRRPPCPKSLENQPAA